MDTSNGTTALQRRIEFLLGEREQKTEGVKAAARLIEQLPKWRDRR